MKIGNCKQGKNAATLNRKKTARKIHPHLYIILIHGRVMNIMNIHILNSLPENSLMNMN